jgi:hypothetical protein
VTVPRRATRSGLVRMVIWSGVRGHPRCSHCPACARVEALVRTSNGTPAAQQALDASLHPSRLPTAGRPWSDRPMRGCHRRRPRADGLRLHRRGQPAHERPAFAVAAPVLRHRRPPRPPSSRDYGTYRRSVLPLCGWQRPQQAPLRHPRPQLLCHHHCPHRTVTWHHGRASRPVAPVENVAGTSSGSGGSARAGSRRLRYSATTGSSAANSPPPASAS